jgi:hypothetical protein
MKPTRDARMSRLVRLFLLACIWLSLAAGVGRAQPYTLTTGAGNGDVSVGVDGYGAFGLTPGPDSSDALWIPMGGPAVPLSTMATSGIALRIGAVGPRAFLTSGTIGGSGGLPKVAVAGTASTGASNFLDPSGKLSFNLVQTVAPYFNGAVRAGAILTQTYTITNTTAAPITFELVRYMDSQRLLYNAGQFFGTANAKEVLYSDENPINPLAVGITGIGGTPLAANRFEIKDYPFPGPPAPVGVDITTGAAMNDTVAGGLPYNVTQGLRSVFTVGPAASTVYTAEMIWCNNQAAIFAAPPTPPTPAPGVLYGVSTTTNQLFTINTAPTAGIGAGLLVGKLSSGMQSPGLAFRNQNLYAWDQVANRVQQIDPATASTLATIDIGLGVPGLGGDMAFRSDGIGFLSQGLPFYRFDITVPNNTPLPATSVPVSGMAFDAADNLIALRPSGAQLYTLDQVTGVATPYLGPTGLAGGIGGAIAYDNSGNLYAAVINPSLATFLYKIDLVTGNATLLGNLGVTQLTGLACYPGASAKGGNPGNGEGTYVGCKGPPAADPLLPGEGIFSFGGGMRQAPKPRLPVLRGPIWDGCERNLLVFNVAHQQAAPEPDAGASWLPLGCVSIAILALALIAVRVARYRST